MKPKTVLVSGLLLAVGALAVLSPSPAQAQARPAPMREVPYATKIDIALQSGNGADGFSPDAVPSNKRLVIEFVSIVVTAQSGDKPSLFLSDTVNGHARSYWIPLTLTEPAGAGANEVYRATQLVKLYHDGNGVNGPGAQCARNFNSFTLMSCHVTLSGYLIDK